MKLVHVFSAPQSVYFFLEGQVQYMKDNGIEVHIIMPMDDFYTEEILLREPGISFHFVALKREISPLHDLKSLLQIYSLLLKLKPDILHLHTPKASFIGALAGRLALCKNIFYQMHGLVSSDGIKCKKNFIYYLEKYTCSLATQIYAVSNSIRFFAIANGYCRAKKIAVLGNGTINGIDWQTRFNPLNVSRYKYLSKQVLENRFVVGYVGRISEEKGIPDFLKVVAELKDKLPLLAIIAGKNEIGDKFDEYLVQYGLKASNVLLILDEISDPENLICQFDLLLFPTKREGFGLVAAEANALEVPVVAYDIPGVKDAVENGSTGTLVPYGDITGLQDAIFTYYNEPEKKRQHGRNGRKRVIELYSREELWKSILEIYQSSIVFSIKKIGSNFAR